MKASGLLTTFCALLSFLPSLSFVAIRIDNRIIGSAGARRARAPTTPLLLSSTLSPALSSTRSPISYNLIQNSLKTKKSQLLTSLSPHFLKRAKKKEILKQVDTLIGFNPVSLLTDSNLLDGVKWNLVIKPQGPSFRRPHYRTLQISLESSLTFTFSTLTSTSLYKVSSLTRSEITLTRLSKKYLGIKLPSLSKSLSLKIDYLDGDLFIFTEESMNCPHVYSSSVLNRSNKISDERSLSESKVEKKQFNIGEAYVVEEEGKDTNWTGGGDDMKKAIKEFK